MKLIKTFLLILFCFSGLYSECKITNPEAFSIIKDDFIKLQINCTQNQIKIDSVKYIIKYLNLLKNNKYLWDKKKQTVISPFEYVLDFQNKRDTKLFIKAVIFNDYKQDTLGSEFDNRGVPIILDRKSGYKDLFLKAYYLYHKKKDNIISFKAQNNMVLINSFWDKESLYFDIHVKDKHLNSVKTKKMDYGLKKGYFDVLWTSDGIELCFDTKNNKNEWRSLDDKELIVNINNEFQGNMWDLEKKEMLHWTKKANVNIQTFGTINNNNDVDSGYNITVAIPLSIMGKKIGSMDSIGFDFQIFDLDSKDGSVFRSFWSNSDFGTNDNPSEWGHLIFINKRSGYKLFVIISFLTLIVLIFLLYYIKQNKSKKVHHSIKKIIELIDNEYSSLDLNRKNIAKKYNLSEQYLSSLFKQETKMNLVEYINFVRINKAKSLLNDSTYTVSEIAFKVGFNTIQNFNKTFKKITGVTPSQYRQNSE